MVCWRDVLHVDTILSLGSNLSFVVTQYQSDLIIIQPFKSILLHHISSIIYISNITELNNDIKYIQIQRFFVLRKLYCTFCVYWWILTCIGQSYYTMTKRKLRQKGLA